MRRGVVELRAEAERLGIMPRLRNIFRAYIYGNEIPEFRSDGSRNKLGFYAITTDGKKRFLGKDLEAARPALKILARDLPFFDACDAYKPRKP